MHEGTSLPIELFFRHHHLQNRGSALVNGLTITRNILSVCLCMCATFGLGACGDSNNVSTPEPAAPPPPLVIATGTPINGTVGIAFSRQLNAVGGSPPYTWSVDGTPPPAPGLTLSSAGLISGTPNAPGIFTLTYRVTDTTNQSTPKNLKIGRAHV